MEQRTKTFITPAEYLEMERKAAFKSEYYNGEMFAFAGGSDSHNIVSSNVHGAMYVTLKSKGCRAYTSDMRLYIEKAGLYTYPDSMVICGQREFFNDRKDTILNPSLIVEVLSPSTETYDRGKKFGFYRNIVSLREYFLISSLEIYIERFSKNDNGLWQFSDYATLQDQIEIPHPCMTISLADIYEGVDFA